MALIYYCERCRYLFEDRDGRDTQCPDCGKPGVRPATEEEQKEYARDRLYTECTCSTHVKTPQGALPVAGVIVALKASENGEAMLTAVTDRDGYCSFGQRLEVKTYYVQIVETPVGYTYTGGNEQVTLREGYTTQISFLLEELSASDE